MSDESPWDDEQDEQDEQDEYEGEGEVGTEKPKRLHRPPTIGALKVGTIPTKVAGQRGGTPRHERFRPLLETVASDPGEPYRIALYNSTRGANDTKKALNAAIEAGLIGVDGGVFELTAVTGVDGPGTSGLYATFHVGE